MEAIAPHSPKSAIVLSIHLSLINAIV